MTFVRQVFGLVLIAAAIWLGLKFQAYCRRNMRETTSGAETARQPAPGKLPGMAAELEPSLDEAKRAGPEGLKGWLRLHRQDVQDPRLTEIELDYVVLVGRSQPAEARRVLAAIGQRLPPGSPVYKRFEQLDRLYR